MNNNGQQPAPSEPLLTVAVSSRRKTTPSAIVVVTDRPSLHELTSKESVLTALRTSPSTPVLLHVLAKLPTLDIHTPSPKLSIITKTLLETTVPDFWHTLSVCDRGQLAQCLCSVTGLGGLVARLKDLAQSMKKLQGVEADAKRMKIEDCMAVLQMVIGIPGLAQAMWNSVGEHALIWREFVALMGGGKILGAAAEAEDAVGRIESERRGWWVGSGPLFAAHLGTSMAEDCRKELSQDTYRGLSVLLSRSFGLGYTDSLVEALTYPLLSETNHLVALLVFLAPHEKRTFLSSLLLVLSRRHLSTSQSSVPAAAALLSDITADVVFLDLLTEWTTTTPGISQPLALRRAVICVLSHHPDRLVRVFEKSLSQFADKLWIRHTPLGRQEATTEILLLCVGYLHRSVPAVLSRYVRGGTYLSAISNRLEASSRKARFLGLVVAENTSALVDFGRKLDFGEEMEEEEAIRWRDIVLLHDEVGHVSSLLETPHEAVVHLEILDAKPLLSPGATLNEFESSDDDGDEEEFAPYAKPSTDVADPPSTDAADISRKIVPPPVYIRTLLSYLRNTTSHEHISLALMHAASLIRRKATTPELLSHSLELTMVLVNIHDTFSLNDFTDLKIQALQALVLADARNIAPKLVTSFWDGGLGLKERAEILLVLGTAARELAGLEPSPSYQVEGIKQLSPEVAHLWGAPTKKEDGTKLLAMDLKKLLISPMAEEAASALSGPNIMKLDSTRKFSSRMEVLGRSKAPEARRGDLLAKYIFLPLIAGFFSQQIIQPLHPHLLSTYLKTLALTLHAIGPNSPHARDLIQESFTLLSSTRTAAGRDLESEGEVVEAVLLGAMVGVEILEEIGVSEMAREVVEWGSWGEGVYEALSTDGGKTDLKGLAAAFVMNTRRLVEKEGRRLWREVDRGQI